MDDALLVRGGEARARSGSAYSRALRTGEAPLAEPLAQGLALRGAPRRRRARPSCWTDVVDREEVGVVQQRRRPRLLLEARRRSASCAERRRENLDGDVAPEARVPGAVDLAHPSGAERRQDLVGAETGARREAHPVGAILSRASGRRRERALDAPRLLRRGLRRRRLREVSGFDDRDLRRIDVPAHGAAISSGLSAAIFFSRASSQTSVRSRKRSCASVRGEAAVLRARRPGATGDIRSWPP